MKKSTFYKRCNAISLIAILMLVASGLFLIYVIGRGSLIPIIIAASLVFICLLIGLITSILSLGEYKPKKWPPDMPFPIIYQPNNYAIVYLEETYWVIEYYETFAETKVMFLHLKEKNKMHLKVFKKEYDSIKGFYNKQLNWI